MLADLKWAFETVVWPPATKLVRQQAVDLKRWLLLVSISAGVMCWTLIAGTFLMTFVDPATGKAFWVGVSVSVIAAYFAYLLFVFGKLPTENCTPGPANAPSRIALVDDLVQQEPPKRQKLS